jgi:hypothetical protein
MMSDRTEIVVAILLGVAMALALAAVLYASICIWPVQ